MGTSATVGENTGFCSTANGRQLGQILLALLASFILAALSLGLFISVFLLLDAIIQLCKLFQPAHL